MANHDHHRSRCSHELAFCERCDVPYCTQCKREWISSNWGVYTPGPVGFETYTLGGITTPVSVDINPPTHAH